MSFSNEQLDVLKAKLLEEKKELMSHLKDAKVDSSFGGGAMDLEDEADETEEYANFLGVEEVEEEAIHNIELALDKMNEETYGICEQCGDEISYDLLSIKPESKLCRACKLVEKK